MASEPRSVDPQKIKASGERIFGYLKGMGVSAMIYLGDKLGLYQAMQNAGPLTSLELALIPAGAALAGVTLGIFGNGYLDGLRERRAAKQQRDQAIAELLTATVDLITGIQAIRAAYLKQTPWRHYVRASAAILAAAGTVLGSEGELTPEILRDWHRMGPGLDRVLAADRELDEKQRTAALDMVTVVLPRTVRFYAAVAVLTLGPDKAIAAAVRELTPQVAALVEVITARQRKYDRARHRADSALGKFRAVADKRR